MAKYKFRLNTLQKVREAHRDQQRASLAEAFRAEQVLAENRRLTAAVAAPNREAARAALVAPDRPRRKVEPAEHEPVKSETIGI